MKYLYRILRLFFCPHVYDKVLSSGAIVSLRAGGDIGKYYDKECKHCGKVKRFIFEV